MKSRRILAAVMAPVCAVSAMAIVANAADETTKVNENKSFTGTTNAQGALTVKQYNQSEYEFAADDVIVATVKAPQGVDASKWTINLNGGGNSWNDWANVSAEYGETTITATIQDVMDALEITDISKFDAIILQVWNAADGEAEVTLDYEITIGAAEEEGDSSESSEETSSETSEDTSSETSTDTSTETSDATSDDTSTEDSDTPAESGDANDSDTPAKDDDSKTDDSSEEAKPVVIEDKVTLTADGIEGKALEEAFLVKDNKKYAWKDVETVSFSSDKAFSVQYNVKAGAVDGDAKATVFTKGKDTLAKTAVESEWGTAWTLDADDIKAINEAETPNVKLVPKEAGTEITATVTLVAGAQGEDVKTDDAKPDNKPTGIALAAAPVILAGALVAVSVVNKKRK